MKDKVVVGVIGAGGITRSQHLPNLTRSPRIFVKTVCDLNLELAKDAQRHYSIQKATAHHEELLADDEIDAVVIATREDSHVSLTVEALEYGKHVYVEKPLAQTEEECSQVVDKVRATGKIAVVGFNRRMSPAYRTAKRILATHGGPKNIHYRIADDYADRGVKFNYNPGDRVMHEMCHIFDILRYLTESEVESVYCVTSRSDDEAITLQFESGCVATIMSTGYVRCDMPKEHLEVIAEVGGLFVSDFAELKTFALSGCEPVYRFAGHRTDFGEYEHKYMMAKCGEQQMMDLRRVCYENLERLEELRRQNADTPERREREEFEERVRWYLNYSVNKGWQETIDHFAECIIEGRLSELATAYDGLIATQIVEASMSSRESGKVVYLENRTAAPLQAALT